MVIVSQDRNEIINFDNVERIDIIVSTDPWCYNVNFETDGTRDLLGNYATEERAKEVLQEIITRYESWENMKVGQPSEICLPVYEMPEE